MEHWKRFRITCASCGEAVLRGNKSETCSIKCRDILKKKRRLDSARVSLCPICGVSAKLSVTASGTKVCSERCKTVVWQRLDRRKGSRALKDIQKTHLGADRPCVTCGEIMLVTRHDLRFCSTKCADKWNYAHGAKGINRRKKTAAALHAKNESIGKCALCHTHYTRIVAASVLGRTSKAASALFHHDHKIPKSKGGVDGPPNRRYLCWFCNLARLDIDAKHDNAIAAAGRAFWKSLVTT